MSTESSPNSYYRYKIDQNVDLSSETFLRRLQKAERNRSTHILFDWCDLDSTHVIELKKITQNVQIDKPIQFEHLFSFDQALLNFDKLTKEKNNHFQIRNYSELEQLIPLYKDSKSVKALHFSPETLKDINSFSQLKVESSITPIECFYFWNIPPYNSEAKNSLITSEVGQFFLKNKDIPFKYYFKYGTLKNLEIWNTNIPEKFELECLNSISWEFKSEKPNPKISVIIPTFNNVKFLTQVLSHLTQQNVASNDFEVIVVEDGGQDQTSEIVKSLFCYYEKKINLKFIYWSKEHPQKGPQNFFRAGLARNLGVHHSASDYLLFLDSDMLVPSDFIQIALDELNRADLIQFQRHHIHQHISLKNPTYNSIHLKKDTYIEEENYWSHFFEAREWSLLPNFWKYTCTYALGIKKPDFYQIGRFKKYYVSYGFEDTDVGYQMYKLNKKFKLIKIPLLHLTAYDKMQYKNSAIKRMQLLKKTCALFYLQYLENDIFHTFQNFFRFEKSFVKTIKDLF